LTGPPPPHGIYEKVIKMLLLCKNSLRNVKKIANEINNLHEPRKANKIIDLEVYNPISAGYNGSCQMEIYL